MTLGVSRVAAKQALSDTCVTRVALPAINFVVGPLLLRAWVVARSSQGCGRTMRAPEWVLACTTVSYVAFVAGVPISLAMFSQTGRLSVKGLEPELQEAVVQYCSSSGSTIESVSYNKGL